MQFSQQDLDFEIGMKHIVQEPCGFILDLGVLFNTVWRQEREQKNKPDLLFLTSLFRFTVSFLQLEQCFTCDILSRNLHFILETASISTEPAYSPKSQSAMWGIFLKIL